jgi:hypothetical protein
MTSCVRDVSTATYVFAVCRGGDPSELESQPGIVEGTAVRLLRIGSFHAVVQDVPAADFSEKSLRERLTDAKELERCARAHHAVVCAAACCAPTVPLPLATVYLGDERARSAISGRARELRAALYRVTGRAEWGVKVYAVPEAAGPPPCEPRAAAQLAAASGRAYLERIRARQQERAHHYDAVLRAADLVDAGVRSVSVAARRLRPHGTGLAGERRNQLLNATYLIAEGRRRELNEVVQRLREDKELRRVEIEISGPWVPYSFVEGGADDICGD